MQNHGSIQDQARWLHKTFPCRRYKTMKITNNLPVHPICSLDIPILMVPGDKYLQETNYTH